jgi:hypothetical protein
MVELDLDRHGAGDSRGLARAGFSSLELSQYRRGAGRESLSPRG